MIRSLRVMPFDVIECGDPRLRTLLEPSLIKSGSWSVAELAARQDDHGMRRLQAAAPALWEWAERVAAGTLEDLVADLLHAVLPARRETQLPHSPPRSHIALTVAFGLDGSPPQTMAAGARQVGVTRERARQYAVAFREGLGRCRLWAPPLDAAIGLADGTRSAEELTLAWVEDGLTRRRWTPAAVQSLAKLCCRPTPLAIRAVNPNQRHQAAIRRITVKQLTTASVTLLDTITEAVNNQLGSDLSQQQITETLLAANGFVLVGGWVAGAGNLANDVIRVAFGMLSVTPQLTMKQIHHGLRRRMSIRSLHNVPPVEAIDAVLRTHQGFTVDGKGAHAVVSAAVPMRPDQMYAGTELFLIQLLQQAPGHFLTRGQILAAATASGHSAQRIQVLLFGHPLIRRHDRQIWTLEGVHVDPNLAAQARAAIHPAPVCQVLPDGRPYWTTPVTPGLRNHGLAQRQTMRPHAGKYQLHTPAGDVTMRISANGTLYGLNRFLRGTDLCDGAILTIAIDTSGNIMQIKAVTNQMATGSAGNI